MIARAGRCRDCPDVRGVGTARGRIDIDACRARGIRIAAVNERHEAVDVFSYLGPLALRALQDAGVAGMTGASRCSATMPWAVHPAQPHLQRRGGRGLHRGGGAAARHMGRRTGRAASPCRTAHRCGGGRAARGGRGGCAIVQIGATSIARHSRPWLPVWPPQAPRAGPWLCCVRHRARSGRAAAGRGLAAAARVRRGEPVTAQGCGSWSDDAHRPDRPDGRITSRSARWHGRGRAWEGRAGMIAIGRLRARPRLAGGRPTTVPAQHAVLKCLGHSAALPPTLSQE